ncbi:DNA polymerase III, subunit gamma and tau [Candidatus Cerribacteria bacterium 'Amazon FNV 2010 28 9']|uniref:DNA polymerase III subunit gamma/tau n=1 Tax=Candidatus Cerribacteria bacterium 'Amazon FNV 2010 28 9' TaxID=2081795 RepID=A0A317JPW2_9BACT|nr:MAG: DNA polymerase III, subunit gamma and tau [Candidatus Cerribacteria bacterium 'Amazon FNV 2010 28 9']
MSWYRQYRPQTVAGLHITPVRENFLHILESGSFAHAYLLCGPKGTGKTSGARILAKVLNCEKNRETIQRGWVGDQGLEKKAESGKGKTLDAKRFTLCEPCNVCPTCIAITNGTSMCVTEMDAASNRGIDDIRELTTRVGLSPADGVVSVYIIDEVHMLTTEAFNALLKVLEEPPQHVVFILATTERHKVPETILSRCQLIAYRKATIDEVWVALRAIATAERIEASDEVLRRIATLADGSLRDGVKLFEQVGKGKTSVTLDEVNSSLGEGNSEIVEQFITALAKKDIERILTLCSTLEQGSINGAQFQKDVLSSLHARLIGAPAKKNPHFPTYVALLQKLNVAISPNLPIPWLPFELAAMEWCLSSCHSVGGSEACLHTESTKTELNSLSERKKSSDKPDATFKNEEQASSTLDSLPLTLPKEKEVVDVKKKNEEPLELESIPIDFQTFLSSWHSVLQLLKSKNSSLEALLRSTKPTGIAGKYVEVSVSYKFHKEQLELDRNLLVIEDVLFAIYKLKMTLRFSLVEKAKQAAISPDSNLSGVVHDVSLVKAAEDAFL